MVDQCLSADAQILGDLGIVPALSFEVVDERIELAPIMFRLRHRRTS
jgi:hypothetical protein